MIDVSARLANTAFYMLKNNMDPTSLIESFRPNQLECKSWLVEEICNFRMEWNKVLVVGSWNACLMYELFQQHGDVLWFDFLDNDPAVHKDRDLYFELNNLPKNYNSITMDGTEFSDYEHYDLVINTSCEHMKEVPAAYGPLYALQSNNYRTIPEHINCVNSPDQLATQYRINRVMHSDTKQMDRYERYMVIGYFQ